MTSLILIDDGEMNYEFYNEHCSICQEKNIRGVFFGGNRFDF